MQSFLFSEKSFGRSKNVHVYSLLWKACNFSCLFEISFGYVRNYGISVFMIYITEQLLRIKYEVCSDCGVTVTCDRCIFSVK